jgi:hypothetical protein
MITTLKKKKKKTRSRIITQYESENNGKKRRDAVAFEDINVDGSWKNLLEKPGKMRRRLEGKPVPSFITYLFIHHMKS